MLSVMTYFETASLSRRFTDPESIVPAQPLSLYAGLRMNFSRTAVARSVVSAAHPLAGARFWGGYWRMRVLLIEDDAMIGQGLSKALTAEGMSVDWVRNGAAAEIALRDSAYSITLLDLGLPDGDGLDVLKVARGVGVDTPVLIITARDELDDRVAGLDLGADDYLVKPFATRELLARMRALARRRAGRATSVLIAGATELDTETHQLSCGEVVQILPAREYALMQALMERPGRILSRAQIEERIYGWGEEVESNAVDVLIHSIRRKFGKEIILNVRGAGWMAPKS